MIRTQRFSRRLRRSTSGVAMVEFALAMPFFLAAALGGVETANLAISNMRVSQMAIHLADNASRVGDTSTLENRRVFESDINDVFVGSNLQAGRIDFYAHGRAVISSLEVFDDTVHCLAAGCTTSANNGDQFISWQRCMGAKNFTPTYGTEGDIRPSGMGPAGEEVTAEPGDAVIFVEVSYDYQPLVAGLFTSGSVLTSTAAFNVRDSRDLSGLHQRNPASPDPVSDCSTFSAYT